MKFFFVFCLLFLANCESQTTSLVLVNSSNQNSLVIQPSNNTNSPPKFQYDNDARLNELKIQNKKFKVIPEEFKKVDFENFTYPTDYPKKSVTLKDGEFKYQRQEYAGGGSFGFSEVYFVDLTGDNKKEAIVFLIQVDCGASCDGGAYLLYIYNRKQQKPNLIWQLTTGGLA